MRLAPASQFVPFLANFPPDVVLLRNRLDQLDRNLLSSFDLFDVAALGQLVDDQHLHAGAVSRELLKLPPAVLGQGQPALNDERVFTNRTTNQVGYVPCSAVDSMVETVVPRQEVRLAAE